MGDTATKTTRPAWLPLVAAALVVPTALAGLTLLWPRQQIEDQLTQSARTALAGAGFSQAGLRFNGRDATLSGIPEADRQAAIDAVQGVAGVRVAAFPVPGSGGGTGTGNGPAGPPPAPAPAPAPPGQPAQPFGIARSGDTVVLTGAVGSEDERARLLAAAKATAGGHEVVDKLTVAPGSTLPAGVDATSIGAATTALAAASGDLAVSIAADKVTLTGAAASDAAKAAAGQALRAALGGIPVDNQLTVAPAAAPAGDLDAAAKAKLQAGIDQLLAASPITFGPDSPQLTAQGRDTVAKVMDLVRAATGVRLQIDGYVATGPGNGRLTAQQLSDQRAATVRDALVAGGVAADHVVARGLGEGTTPTDRALGRRVVITVA
ncbi:OmpA family protein [Pseudonocardia sp. GCM10023141]|uniref:channel-forming protein ArfA/OmpATb n=1 Tax=Pseudonocardia sp. GCM10023141 TaxID=3252653 RepID=UPI00360E4962